MSLSKYYILEVIEDKGSESFPSMHRDKATCGSCANFIGAGDWNLCCKNPPEEEISWCGHLCYEDTPACKNYIIK